MIARYCASALLCMLLACGGDTVLHTCDIRESSCQFDVFLAVQDVRGNGWDPWLEPPSMRVISEEAYRAEVTAAHEQSLRDAGVDYFTLALKLLFLIDPSEPPNAETEFKVGKVSAYYETSRKRVTIVDHGKELTLPGAVKDLAHELVHAAQDRDIGFSRLFQRVASTDNSSALTTLLEGEAEMYSLLVDAKQLGIAKGAISWDEILVERIAHVRDEAFADPSPYRVVSSQLPYPLGATYLARAYLAGGPPAVRQIYDDPPLSAARFMAGLGAVGDRAMPAWRCDAPEPPPGFELWLGDELGAFGMYALGTRITSTETDAWVRAGSWQGDRFYIYTSPSDQDLLTVVWRLRIQDRVTASNFLNGLAFMPLVNASQESQMSLEGDTLDIIVSNAPLDPDYEAWRQCVPL